ncbi:histidinol-phosphatase (PHP family) [Propionispira arboris]|uniref:Histidinol-phosphatase n=1 Tax=Propionispira arboris TaxID=84035 RepID=A0A1H6TQ11_9FIRM|nr:histidinol phosphate phosphatase [Propionispira arboris]SEI77822.1 histidinol-phosphatase (PHP family) [Propionispira arboris]
MIFDTHLHTKVSADSEMQITEALTRARELKLGLIVTEHMDFDYPDPSFIFDPQAYFTEYASYRSESLLLGVEIGMQESCYEKSRALAEENQFDYVIGSIHLLEHTGDIYYPAFYGNRLKQEVYSIYFKTMADSVKQYSFIDALGHIDYIARYAPYAEPEIYYHEFAEQIDEVLQALITHDTVIELNTRRLGDRSVIKSLAPIYKRYYDLGGRYVTLGSDAHKMVDIGSHFTAAKELSEWCNLKMVYFKNRRMQYV